MVTVVATVIVIAIAFANSIIIVSSISTSIVIAIVIVTVFDIAIGIVIVTLNFVAVRMFYGLYYKLTDKQLKLRNKAAEIADRTGYKNVIYTLYLLGQSNCAKVSPPYIY